MFVYTIQPVIKPVVIPVVKRVWQPVVSCIQPVVKPVVQPGLTTGWTNSGCSFNTVVTPVVKPGCTTGLTTVLNEQSLRSTRLSNRSSNPFDNRFDNRLDVCLHDTTGCQPQTGCRPTTGLTTVVNVEPTILRLLQIMMTWHGYIQSGDTPTNDMYITLCDVYCLQQFVNFCVSLWKADSSTRLDSTDQQAIHTAARPYSSTLLYFIIHRLPSNVSSF